MYSCCVFLDAIKSEIASIARHFLCTATYRLNKWVIYENSINYYEWA
jgi:hypothetical protein